MPTSISRPVHHLLGEHPLVERERVLDRVAQLRRSCAPCSRRPTNPCSRASRSTGTRARPRPGGRTRRRRGRRAASTRARFRDPAPTNICFIAILSIATAEPSTPAPTYGRPASSSTPCTVPSSPYGPCNNGITTSASSVAVVRDALGTGMRSPSTANAAGNASRPDGEHLLRFAGEQPATVGRDADGHDVVLRGIERAGDRDRGDPRDVVLGRLTAEQEHDSAARTRAQRSFWLI